jgi:ABC-type transport system involved in multi-copper enzyme maturation permease subunit
MLGPIFVREWLTLPRRAWHYLLRAVYLGLLWVLALTAWQVTVGWEQAATLGDTARFSLFLFQILAYAQLTLVLFFASLSAASTIAQEKDRRTFVLLLITDLRNYEIVLGKLLGSLLQILIFLTGTVPVLFLTVLMGGVAPFQVLQATVVLVTTALAAGSLGSLMALWRDKTFQALALTVLVLVLYLCLIEGLSILPALTASITPEQVRSWQSWLEPYRALNQVVEPAAPPLLDGAHGRELPAAYGLALVMLGWSVLLNAWGILRLRVWNPSGEPIMQRERPEGEVIDRAKAHAAPGALRPVWANPILWREVATRAYGRRPLVIKLAYFLVVALVAYYALSSSRGEWVAAWGLVPISILSLLLIAAQAVTAITTERDLGALDLLLVTDLTPREFIYGKLWGIVYNAKEYVLPPLILVAIYAARGLLASPSTPGRNAEAFLAITGGGLILFAFTIILGVHIALGTQNSRLAVINTLGAVFFLSGGTLVCIYLILINGRFESQWLSFSGFIVAGWGGLWWVLNGERPSTALFIASWWCPLAVFYSVTNVLIGKPGLRESTDPFLPFLVTGGAFAFAIAAMLVPLLAEFDVALGRTSAPGE